MSIFLLERLKADKKLVILASSLGHLHKRLLIALRKLLNLCNPKYIMRHPLALGNVRFYGCIVIIILSKFSTRFIFVYQAIDFIL